LQLIEEKLRLWNEWEVANRKREDKENNLIELLNNKEEEEHTCVI